MSTRKSKATKGSRHLPIQGVPDDAPFVNRTDTTDAVIKAGCTMACPNSMRLVYLLVGIALGIAAVVARMVLHVDILSTVLVLILGLLMVWQARRLPLLNAGRMIRQVGRGGDQARQRTYFADEEGFCVVLGDGTVRSFPWDQMGTFMGNQKVMAITLRSQSVLFCLSMDGFIRGTGPEFAHYLQNHLPPLHKGAFQRLADRVFHVIDDWSVINADDLQAQRDRKQAKWDRRQAKLDAKLARKAERRQGRRG